MKNIFLGFLIVVLSLFVRPAALAIELTSSKLNSNVTQEAVDIILSTFKKLPNAEIERLGVDLMGDFNIGSSNAQDLLNAWYQRQAEIKQVVDSMVKPAELMANITKSINEANAKNDQISQGLTELENLLTDIDNARDFHTIGGWPILVSFLHHSKSTEHRSQAALAIGTAIKNDYDYQLWTLETPSTLVTVSDHHSAPHTPSCISLLIDIINEAPTDSEGLLLLQRTLYALSSASRGNIEVQEAALRDERLLPSLHRLESVNSLKIKRKLWAFVSDMLYDARAFKQHISEMSMEEKEKIAIASFHLIGQYLCTEEWVKASETSLSLNADLIVVPHNDGDEQQKVSLDTRYLLESLLSSTYELMQGCRSLFHAYHINRIKEVVQSEYVEDLDQDVIQNLRQLF